MTKRQIYNILGKLGFNAFGEGFRKGTSYYIDDNKVCVHTWDHDYFSRDDYYDDTIKLNDFKITSWDYGFKLEEKTKLYQDLMSKKFGQEYIDDLNNNTKAKKVDSNIKL